MSAVVEFAGHPLRVARHGYCVGLAQPAAVAGGAPHLDAGHVACTPDLRLGQGLGDYLSEKSC